MDDEVAGERPRHRGCGADVGFCLGELRLLGVALGPLFFGCWLRNRGGFVRGSKSWRRLFEFVCARLALPKKAKGGGAALKLSAGNLPVLA